MEETQYIKPTVTIVAVPVRVLMGFGSEGDGDAEGAEVREQETVNVVAFDGTYNPIKSNW